MPRNEDTDGHYEVLCNSSGCLEDQAPGSRYCHKHSASVAPALEDQPELDVTDADIRHATIPNAAVLLRLAKAKGYITATSAYAGVA